MPVSDRRHSPEEAARLGAELFQQHVRPALPTGDADRFVAIDLVTGDYELDEDD